jgi:YkoY family integral membrane protein
MFFCITHLAPLAEARFLEQSFEFHDLFVIGLLVVLEGVLSIDNALVLGLLARRLPKHLRGKALTYGLVGALVFRIAAIFTASLLLRWTFAKFLGGAYLIYVSLKHFLFGEAPHDEVLGVGPDGQPQLQNAATGEPLAPPSKPPSAKPVSLHSLRFWHAVLVIELTDIAFAVDSIVAAMALVGQQKASDTGAHDKLWVVVAGGMIGVILMRFAAVLFIKLLERFPRFETAAYLLVVAIGVKLLLDWWFNAPSAPERINFHSPSSPAFWVFWSVMLLCFAVGFIPSRKKTHPTGETPPNQVK